MTPSNPRDSAADTPQSGRRRRRVFGRETHLITSAKLAPGQDRHRREVIYSILQFVRIPSLIIAGVLISVWHWWIAAAAVVAVTFPLPWIAVVIGNSRGQKRDKREKSVYKPALARQMAQAQRESLERPAHRQLPSESDPTEPTTIDHED
ncbi:DUF3099 domain-containing protein [Corynebacterium sp.]|uniref:DUF3099 domain-containing protein n=1 Tax=Corynebacterium sp. TaxID=1720 RepID=UPI0027BA1EAC|nr:DUF3099 domain-containing protein [Corynebacterium sp.]